MKTRVTTTIDGKQMTFTGKLSKDGKTLNAPKGMKLTILPTDTIEQIITERNKTTVNTYCALDIHKWFKASRQI